MALVLGLCVEIKGPKEQVAVEGLLRKHGFPFISVALFDNMTLEEVEQVEMKISPKEQGRYGTISV